MSSKSRKKRKSKMKTSRKTRPKTRSLQKLNSPESAESHHHPPHQQQLNLFPLHPEEKDDTPKLSYFFNTDDTATLNSFIWRNNNNNNNNSDDDESSICRSYPLDPLDHNHSDEVTTTTTTSSLLERSALRGNVKRDLSEEKWVCYEEVTSCVPEYWKRKPKEEEDCGGGLLLLKLDYDEIMNAWSDKGAFCIGEGCQIVPDMLDDVLRQDGFLDTGNVPTLQVPDDGSSVMENRAARVLRYKEKRQNRLFAKRIRYEVRKLNAEKRPRMKGRFVKRSED